MRAVLVLAFALLAPLAVAEPAETIRQCTELGCIIVQDTDGDGAHEWANVALAAEEALVANANVNRTILTWEVDATTEELGGETGEAIVHELGEATGEDIRVLTLTATGGANLTARDGSVGFHDADVLIVLLWLEHDTGAQEIVVWQYARLYDADGDSVPDGVETLP